MHPNASFTYKVDTINRLGFENISSFTPLSAPVSDGTPKTEPPPPPPYPDPVIVYPRPPTPTGVRIPN